MADKVETTEGFLTGLAELVSAAVGAYMALDVLTHGELTARVKAWWARLHRPPVLTGYDPVMGEAAMMGEVRRILDEANAKGGTT